MTTTSTTPPEGPKTMPSPAPFEAILRGVHDELVEQEAKWGGLAHDREHSLHDWLAILAGRTGDVFKAGQSRIGHLPGYRLVRRRLLQVAAVAVSAIRAFDAKRMSVPPGHLQCMLCAAEDPHTTTKGTAWIFDADSGEPEPLCDDCREAL